jgi:hypothetical protein
VNNTALAVVALAAIYPAVSQLALAKDVTYRGTVDIREATGNVAHVSGRVCEVLNRDSVCQPGEPGIKGVLVSDSLNVVENRDQQAWTVPRAIAKRR